MTIARHSNLILCFLLALLPAGLLAQDAAAQPPDGEPAAAGEIPGGGGLSYLYTYPAAGAYYAGYAYPAAGAGYAGYAYPAAGAYPAAYLAAAAGYGGAANPSGGDPPAPPEDRPPPEDRRVALVPFWGEDDGIISQFGEELYAAVAAIEGFAPRWVDMVNLPADVPEGGFPPFVAPSLSLTLDSPFSITGDLSSNPVSGQWHLRLFLWQMADNRLLFSDEMAAFGREDASVTMPFLLEWLFSWIPTDEAAAEPMVIYLEREPEVIVERVYLEREPAEPIVERVYVELEPEVIVERVYVEREPEIIERVVEAERPAPPPEHHWLYAGARGGWSLTLLSDPWNGENIDTGWRNFHAAASAHGRLHSFQVSENIFLQPGAVLELAFSRDFDLGATALSVPLMPAVTARAGGSAFTLMGGAYAFFPLAASGDARFGLEGESFLWGVTAGARIAQRVGPGYLFTDLRWSRDMFGGARTDYFRRSAASVSIGFEIGLFGR